MTRGLEPLLERDPAKHGFEMGDRRGLRGTACGPRRWGMAAMFINTPSISL
jgi:hypothetical protein